MNLKTLSLLPLLLLSEANGVVVTTYRGDTPNIFALNNENDSDFDVNADGVLDFRFLGGFLVIALQAYGENRFISTLSMTPSAGGEVEALTRGSIIGSDTSTLVGSLHHHTDNRGSGGFGLNSLQFQNAFIGVEFVAADGIHYGWIQYQGFSHPDSLIDTPIGLFHPPAGALGGLVNSWAYETEPGKPIIVGIVPEPSSVMLVGTGIFILLRRRRDHSVD